MPSAGAEKLHGRRLERWIMAVNPASRVIQFRRSLYFVKNMKAGEVITKHCIRSVRPGYGLAPKHLAEILGRVVTQNIEANSAVR